MIPGSTQASRSGVLPTGRLPEPHGAPATTPQAAGAPGRGVRTCDDAAVGGLRRREQARRLTAGIGPAAVAILLACLGVAACGGGDDGNDEQGGSASIEGSVNVQGAPAAGAPVGLDAVAEGEDPSTATEGEPLAESETDDDGTYRFADLEPGTYLVFADASGCRILATVEVEADATVTADLEIPSNYTPVGPLSLLPDGNILSC